MGIRHIGLFANACRKRNISQIRQLLLEQEGLTLSEVMNAAEQHEELDESIDFCYQCPECGANMVIIEILAAGQKPRAPPEMRLAS